MLLPLQTHSVQTERIAAQAACSLPTRKRLWQQVVRAKIQAQAEVLTEFRQSDSGLGALLPNVKSGDPTNVEAQAARRYWTALFASNTFRRDPDAQDQNRLLNYGYAVLRAICAAGLHPSLGLHHPRRARGSALSKCIRAAIPREPQAIWMRGGGVTRRKWFWDRKQVFFRN